MAFSNFLIASLSILTVINAISRARRNDKLAKMSIEKLMEEDFWEASNGHVNNVFGRELARRSEIK